MIITEENVQQQSYMYNATDIFEGFEIVENSDMTVEQNNIPCQTSEVSLLLFNVISSF